MQVVSFEDLFGGKLHAAVDRQHPRDLFDVKLLYENEGLTDALFRTFLIYVASSGRPPHELVRPSLADLDEAFVKEFEGMTIEPVGLDDLKAARTRMTADILSKLDDKAMRFRKSTQGRPNSRHARADHPCKCPPAPQSKMDPKNRLIKTDTLGGKCATLADLIASSVWHRPFARKDV
ncbi:hypothetical protein ABIE33_006051 [Ensifer sp. 4252]